MADKTTFTIDQIRNLNIKEFVINGKAMSSTTGYAAYSNTAGTNPVTGTGGTPSVTWTRSTTSPITKEASFLFTKDAVNRQGQGVSYDFSIDNGSKAKVLQIRLDYILTSGTFVAGSANSNSDVTVWIYDITNSTLIQPVNYKLFSNSSTISDVFSSSFQTSATGINYRLIFHVGSTSASAFALTFDNISVQGSTYSTGAPTSIVSIPPTIQRFTTGSGTYAPTNSDVKYIRVKIKGGGAGGSGSGTSVNAGGTGGATTFSTMTANGGTGGGFNAGTGGTASGGNVSNARGETAQSVPGNNSSNTVNFYGGSGASTAFGSGGIGGTNGAGAGGNASNNSGAGAGGGGGSGTAGVYGSVGGSAGGYCESLLAATTYSYAVGSSGGGGAAGTSGNIGGTGGGGIIIVEEYYDSITYISGSTIVGTYSESAITATANWPISANTMGDLTSLSLPAGTWDIQGAIQVVPSGSITTTQLQIGISSTSGNFTTGLNFGQNYFLTQIVSANGIVQLYCPAVRVTPATTTTYYLKIQANTSVTNLQTYGYRLSAVKSG